MYNLIKFKEFFFKLSFCDWPLDSSFGFQLPASIYLEDIIDLHHDVLVFLILIFFFVLVLLIRVYFLYNFDFQYFKKNKNIKKISLIKNNLLNFKIKIPKQNKLKDNYLLEVSWTIIPSIILIIMGIPSLALLYSMDEILDPFLTLKVIGHQWYWSYEYGDVFNQNDTECFSFDSYMIQSDELKEGFFRLLEVDNPVLLPEKSNIRLIVSSADVLHSWAIPSFGIKLDAVPGRLNQIFLNIKRPGTFYGQCSELCGIYHGFMPIAIHVYKLEIFLVHLILKYPEIGLHNEIYNNSNIDSLFLTKYVWKSFFKYNLEDSSLINKKLILLFMKEFSNVYNLLNTNIKDSSNEIFIKILNNFK